MSEPPSPLTPRGLAERFDLDLGVVEDLLARRRAGAHDGELVNLLRQPDRGGMSAERAADAVGHLPS